jgi:hypothetical protein
MVKTIPMTIYNLQRELSQVHTERWARDTRLSKIHYSLTIDEIDREKERINLLELLESHISFKVKNIACHSCPKLSDCQSKCNDQF